MAQDAMSLAQCRAAIARSMRRLRREPSEELQAEVAQLRSSYAELKLSTYIRETVDAAPPLTPDACERLATLLRRGDAA